MARRTQMIWIKKMFPTLTSFLTDAITEVHGNSVGLLRQQRIMSGRIPFVRPSKDLVCRWQMLVQQIRCALARYWRVVRQIRGFGAYRWLAEVSGSTAGCSVTKKRRGPYSRVCSVNCWDAPCYLLHSKLQVILTFYIHRFYDISRYSIHISA